MEKKKLFNAFNVFISIFCFFFHRFLLQSRFYDKKKLFCESKVFQSLSNIIDPTQTRSLLFDSSCVRTQTHNCHFVSINLQVSPPEFSWIFNLEFGGFMGGNPAGLFLRECMGTRPRSTRVALQGAQ